MGINRYGHKRDSCERGIVWTLRKAGCVVYPLSDKGVPDLLVSAPWLPGVNLLLECKDAEKGEPTKDQTIFNAAWKGQRATVSTPREALEAVEINGLNAATCLNAYENELLKPKARQFK